MITVDILEVLLSLSNNHYLLVVKDYLTKWAEAIALPVQTGARITTEMVKIFSTYVPPQILHSDQCRNFESTMLSEALKAFVVEKSQRTPYHPQGDGMFERFNHSLLQLLQSYVKSKNDWECYLRLFLYMYRTETHYSMGDPPFMIMFGGFQVLPQLTQTNAIDATSYLGHLTTKIVEL